MLFCESDEDLGVGLTILGAGRKGSTFVLIFSAGGVTRSDFGLG